MSGAGCDYRSCLDRLRRGILTLAALRDRLPAHAASEQQDNGRRGSHLQLPAWNARRLQVQTPRGFAHDTRVDGPRLALTAHFERAVSQQVDQPRNALRQRGHRPYRRRRKPHTPEVALRQHARRARFIACIRAARNAHAVVDVLGNFVALQAGQFASARHALSDLTHFRASEQGVELRLPRQHDLQQWRTVAIEVRPEPKLLEQHGMQMLRLVDDDDRAAAKRRQRGQEALQHDDQLVQRRGHDTSRRPRIAIEHAKVAQTCASSSSAVTHGSRISETNVFGPLSCIAARHSMLLPVPTSPVMTMNPSRRSSARRNWSSAVA